MTTRAVRPKLLRNLRRLKYGARTTTTTTAVLPGSIAADNQPNVSTATTAAGPDVNFTDTKELFSSVPTSNLLRSLITLRLAAAGPVADLGMWIMKSRLMDDPLCRRTVLGVTERTFYRHFCAGEDLAAANATARELWDSGLTAMLDYGLEHAVDNESCDGNFKEFIRTIDSTKSVDESPVSFVVVKITAICPIQLLKRVSDLLRWEHKDKSMNLPWKLKSFPLLSDSSPFYHTPQRPEPLTAEEEEDLKIAYSRMSQICKSSIEASLPILIDAEDTHIQPAIDYFTYSAAIEFTQGDDEPLIYNTIQAYLRDAKDRLVIAKKSADEMHVPLGIKLVRGAYMASENRLADSLGVQSPIHDGIHNTHACYNECAEFMLHEIARGSGSLVLATHNMDSGKLAAAKAVDLGIEKESERLQFAQLYGMSEALSFGLRNAGFRVSKYLPYGPVEQIIPYLLRRAEENRGLLSASSFDRLLMRNELFRRMTSLGTSREIYTNTA
ncbi:Methylenetetrahydrofolate reductase family protein [Perilla frutescens var. hirtella]|uniref:Proline dehydrogenase n=1 Tax=Perilla frutescens var. hirtella TaxID=608512 RepID=A0AAD4JE78_PERFH|nr:Methylenetetrahydrofolate reductase family protein [Perilla frutescens var. hirtella]